MPVVRRVPVGRLPRYQLLLVEIRLNGWLTTDMVLATTEPTTSVAPRIANYLQGAGALPGGRRVIPSDIGPFIARTMRLARIEIRAMDDRWLEWAPWTVAIAFRPQALGVGGLLSIDALALPPRDLRGWAA